MKHAKSNFTAKPYVSVQLEMDGRMAYFHTSSRSLYDRLQRMEQYLPVKTRFAKRTSAGKMDYLIME